MKRDNTDGTEEISATHYLLSSLLVEDTGPAPRLGMMVFPVAGLRIADQHDCMNDLYAIAGIALKVISNFQFGA
jgi:hypothetical protein